MKKERPFGVKVIIIFQLILGLFSLLVLLATAGLITNDQFSDSFENEDVELDITIDEDDMQVDYELEPSFLLLSLVLALVRPVTAFGLWRGRYWGWALAIILTGVLLVTDLGAYFNDSPAYLSMLINIIIIFYLNQRSVRDAFGATGNERAA